MDIDGHYKSYSPSTRQSLEAWAGGQLDLGLVGDDYSPDSIFYFFPLLLKYLQPCQVLCFMLLTLNGTC